MQTTANYSLKKPEGSDVVNVQDFNDNADIIDTELKNRILTTDYIRTPGYAVATGSANTYVVTLSPVPSSYTDGMCIVVKINATSTGASTLNVNSLGAKSIKDSLGNAITSGGLKANTPYALRYESTSDSFILQGKGGGGNAVASDLYVGKTATVDTGQIVGTNPYKIGVKIKDSNLNVSVAGGTEVSHINGDDPYNSTMAIDKSGNIYSGDSDGNVIKHDSSGNSIWNTKVNGEVLDIAVDDSGNVYSAAGGVTKLNPNGTTAWTVSDGSYSDVTIDSSGNIYAGMYQSSKRIKKINASNGNILWDYDMNDSGASNQYVYVAVDDSGNVYGVSGGDSNYTTSYYIIKLNSDGGLIWKKTTANVNNKIIIDKSGNIYIGGYSGITKYDLNGNVLWTYASSNICAITTDGYNIYGYDFNSHNIVKLNLDGNLIWLNKTNYNSIVSLVFNLGYIYGAISNSTVLVAKFQATAEYTIAN